MRLRSLILFGFAISLMISSTFVYAFTDQDKEAFRMYVQIKNLTGSSCTRKDDITIVHGYLFDTAVPYSILNGDSKSFSMIQYYFYGPDVIISYDCGANSIQFEVQQDYSMSNGHPPSAHVIPENTVALTMSVTDVAPSSLELKTRGKITIVLQ